MVALVKAVAKADGDYRANAKAWTGDPAKVAAVAKWSGGKPEDVAASMALYGFPEPERAGVADSAWRRRERRAAKALTQQANFLKDQGRLNDGCAGLQQERDRRVGDQSDVATAKPFFACGQRRRLMRRRFSARIRNGDAPRTPLAPPDLRRLTGIHLPTLDIRKLGVRYATKNGTVDALSGVDLSMRDGEFLVPSALRLRQDDAPVVHRRVLPPTEGTIESAASR